MRVIDSWCLTCGRVTIWEEQSKKAAATETKRARQVLTTCRGCGGAGSFAAELFPSEPEKVKETEDE